jgi:transcriptional regulator with XRE-family HTH domain
MSTKTKIRAKTEIRKITGIISFGDMLHSFREAQEFTQVQMAALIGITKQDLCNIEKGRKLVSVERAMLFATALNLPSKTFAKYALQDQLNKAGLEGIVSISDVA